ncbi:MAG: chorismate-binding protein, partial [Candidatus Margulisiibacteriota bacterium]
LAFDHVQHKIQIISNAFVKGDPKKAYQAARRKIERLAAKLKRRVKITAAAKRPGRDIFKSNMSQREFEAMVVKAKKYIYAGDIFQVVLSQRFAQKYGGDPFTIYRAMRTVNPSPYMYFLKFDKALQLIGSSPELLVRRVGDTATLRPIAGTRKRGKDKHEDEKLGKELLADAKERAEHIMLVDLGRNDLGRVCEFGSVKVTESMVIERYSHVMHIVSNISGRLRPGIDGLDLLRATFPAGTVSGAPKIRAMEIIDELETHDRGIYAGAVFYLGFNGDLDSCIAIRTMVVKDKVAYAQAGAGIVADSVPRKEYQESLNKCQAMFTSLNRAKGFKNGA